ncbi:MAG TPA: hypothetical protein VF190_13590 [Rhodothermales bacterium]
MPANLKQLVEDASDSAGGARQTRAAARLMSLLESEPHRLPDVYRYLPHDEWPRPKLVLGLTGAPGSGKSTLTDALVAELRQRHPEARIGVIAVDPSSPFTGGAVLGDRVRMMRHALDPLVYVRSLASRGHLGGLSLGVRGVLRVMGLIGCEFVLIETVGVGQSEVEIADVADQVLVVLAPGQGDSIQMLKAGLLEIADLFAINKADTPGADRLQQALLSTICMRATDNGAAEAPEVFFTSATDGTGIQAVLDELQSRIVNDSAAWQSARDERVLMEIRDAVFEEARRRLTSTLGCDESFTDPLLRVLTGELTVGELTQELFERGFLNAN